MNNNTPVVVNSSNRVKSYGPGSRVGSRSYTAIRVCTPVKTCLHSRSGLSALPVKPVCFPGSGLSRFPVFSVFNPGRVGCSTTACSGEAVSQTFWMTREGGRIQGSEAALPGRRGSQERGWAWGSTSALPSPRFEAARARLGRFPGHGMDAPAPIPDGTRMNHEST